MKPVSTPSIAVAILALLCFIINESIVPELSAKSHSDQTTNLISQGYPDNIYQDQANPRNLGLSRPGCFPNIAETGKSVDNPFQLNMSDLQYKTTCILWAMASRQILQQRLVNSSPTALEKMNLECYDVMVNEGIKEIRDNIWSHEKNEFEIRRHNAATESKLQPIIDALKSVKYIAYFVGNHDALYNFDYNGVEFGGADPITGYTVVPVGLCDTTDRFLVPLSADKAEAWRNGRGALRIVCEITGDTSINLPTGVDRKLHISRKRYDFLDQKGIVMFSVDAKQGKELSVLQLEKTTKAAGGIASKPTVSPTPATESVDTNNFTNLESTNSNQLTNQTNSTNASLLSENTNNTATNNSLETNSTPNGQNYVQYAGSWYACTGGRGKLLGITWCYLHLSSDRSCYGWIRNETDDLGPFVGDTTQLRKGQYTEYVGYWSIVSTDQEAANAILNIKTITNYKYTIEAHTTGNLTKKSWIVPFVNKSFDQKLFIQDHWLIRNFNLTSDYQNSLCAISDPFQALLNKCQYTLYCDLNKQNSGSQSSSPGITSSNQSIQNTNLTPVEPVAQSIPPNSVEAATNGQTLPHPSPESLPTPSLGSPSSPEEQLSDQPKALTQVQIQYGINEVYARHGYVFQNKSIQAEFQNQSWYRAEPMASMDQIKGQLSPQEAQRLNTLLKLRNGQVQENASKQTENRSSISPQYQKGTPILSPMDKFPPDAKGYRVAGVFRVKMESSEGGEILVPEEAMLNPFSRQFLVLNRTSGYPRGTLFPIDRQPQVIISKSHPLVIVGKPLPGIYSVEAH